METRAGEVTRSKDTDRPGTRQPHETRGDVTAGLALARPCAVGARRRGARGQAPRARGPLRRRRRRSHPGTETRGPPLPPVEPRWTKKKRPPPIRGVSRRPRARTDRRRATVRPTRGFGSAPRLRGRPPSRARRTRAPAPELLEPARPRRRPPSDAGQAPGFGAAVRQRAGARMPRCGNAQSPRTSPTTLPRIRTSFSPSRTTMGAMVGCSGRRTTACASRANRLTVASPSTSATTMSPGWA